MTPRNVLVHIDTCTPCTLLLFLSVCLVPWKNKTRQTTNHRLRALFFLNVENYTDSIWRAPLPETHKLFSHMCEDTAWKVREDIPCKIWGVEKEMEHEKKRVLSSDSTLTGESTRRRKKRNKKVTYIQFRTGLHHLPRIPAFVWCPGRVFAGEPHRYI